MIKKIVHSYLEQIHAYEREPDLGVTLPRQAFYLPDGSVCCTKREKGISRYPYDADGLVVWARSDGVVEACESLFQIFQPIPFGNDASVYMGLCRPGKQGFVPLPILGGEDTPEQGVRRYTIYAKRAAYYVVETDGLTGCVRVSVDQEKHIRLTLWAENTGKEPLPLCAAAFLEPLMRYRFPEEFWDRMTKYGVLQKDSMLIRSWEDCMVINRAVSSDGPVDAQQSVAKSDALGTARQLMMARSLFTGSLCGRHEAVNTTEMPMACYLDRTELPAGKTYRADYDLSCYHRLDEATAALGRPVDASAADTALALAETEAARQLDGLTVRFDTYTGHAEAGVLNQFIKQVQKQVSFCALGKNYAGPYIGIRDVMQQLESSLLWQPKESREKIVRAFGYVLENGRAPRQFSVPDGDWLPDMDLRPFIDQGNWMITTVYAYLAYTGDLTILDEPVSYYVADQNNASPKTRPDAKSTVTDTLLDHCVRITDYLLSHVDQTTGCLHILYGDWNDALDGLGKGGTEDGQFGDGVSVMASLQLYKNCAEMAEILHTVGCYPEKEAVYEKAHADLGEALQREAVVSNRAGQRRVIHGWGEHKSYLAGSFCDGDGVDRVSSAATSFWSISGMLKRDVSLKKDLLASYQALESVYGYLTFSRPFGADTQQWFGRIGRITPGTYENAATYVHAGLFACLALYEMGESRQAAEQLDKLMVITHDNCTMTPFVMPNSYCYNPAYGMDGESMGDWYTGSGTVMMKVLVQGLFGLHPSLSGLRVTPAAYWPTDGASLHLNMKGRNLTVRYRRTGVGRTYTVNGRPVDTVTFNEGLPTGFELNETDLTDQTVIEITD